MKNERAWLNKPEDIKLEEALSAAKPNLKRIWKYGGAIVSKERMLLPAGAIRVLHLQETSAGQFSFWLEFDVPKRTTPSHDIPLVSYECSVIATGELYSLEAVGDYVGMIMSPPYVWHVFLKLLADENSST